MALVLRPPGSRESLPDTLADLGRSRKTVSLIAGLLAFLAAGAGVILVACVLDSLFDLSPLARGFALITALTITGIVWRRGVSRALALRTDALAVALELEDKYPKLNDSLASAVAFLDAEDAEERGVSRRLQDSAVASARRAASRHDFDKLVPTGRCWKMLWACIAIAAVALPISLFNTPRSAVAVTRLADPFGSHPWPTQTRIAILLPEEFPGRIAKGEPFDLKFVVRGVIKDHATVVFRVNGGEEFEEQFPLSIGNDGDYPNGAVITARIEPARVALPFEFRIASNDADTGWQAIDVVPPPRLVPFIGPEGTRHSPRFHVIPPQYTGLPASDLPDGATAIEVPVGSVVRMTAMADSRLASAILAFSGESWSVAATAGLIHLGHLNPFSAVGMQALADTIGSDIAVSLDETRRLLKAEFAPSLSGVYALRMTDETGLSGMRTVEIRLIPDPSPTVNLLRPAAGKDPAILTPDASITIHVTASDKLYAVRSGFLEYRVGASGRIRKFPLVDSRDSIAAIPAVVGAWSAFQPARPVSIEARIVLPLATLTRDGSNPLRDGDTLFLRGAADDWDDVTPAKQPGRTGEVEIRIASAESVEAWLERELIAIRPELARARDQQWDARQKTGEVAPQPDGSLQPADRDQLLASEQMQRLIRGKLGDDRDGVRAKADLLLATVQANNLPRSNTTDRVRTVADVLERLVDRELPVIEPSLSEARQVGSQPAQAGNERTVAELLARAGRHQKAVEDGVTDLLDLLSIWGGAVETRGEARLLRDFVRRQIVDLERTAPEATTAELDRAGTRAEQASDQANQLMTRADKLAGQKESEAEAIRAKAAVVKNEAANLRAKAADLPTGTPEKSTLNARAAILDGEAINLEAVAAKAVAESAALRDAVKVAGGQSLPNELRSAGVAARKDRRADATTFLRSAEARLDKIIDSLAEKPPETAPDLVKLKKGADDLDALAAAQDELRRKALEAARIPDAAKRDAELNRLAADQQKLIERAEVLLQQLTRERADQAARDVRGALDSMQASRADLKEGATGIRPQNEAVERLDRARDRLDATVATVPQKLSDEKRRKVADRIKALLERQQAAIVETNRIHELVAKGKGWQRELEASYFDVADVRETKLAEELQAFAKDFDSLPVLARVVAEAQSGMNAAAERITERLKEIDPTLAFDAELETANDRRVRRPMDLAARRLEQLLEALNQKEPKPKSPSPTQQPPNEPKTPPPNAGNTPVDRDLVPPLAQLKVLRALQSELNQRTAEFAKLVLDPENLTEDERTELKEIEDAQREIATLFESLSKLFQEQKSGAGDGDENPKQPNDPANDPKREKP